MSIRERATDNMDKVKIDKDRLKKSLQIFSYLLPHKSYFIAGMVALLFSSLTVMVIPKSLGILIDVSMGKQNSFLHNRGQIALFLSVHATR